MQLHTDTTSDNGAHEYAIVLTKKEVAALAEVVGPKKGPLSSRVLWVDFMGASVCVAGTVVAVRASWQPTWTSPPHQREPFAISMEHVVNAAKAKQATHVVIASAMVGGFCYVSSAVSTNVIASGSSWAAVDSRSVGPVRDLDVDFADVAAMWSTALEPEEGEHARRSFRVATDTASALAKLAAASSTDDGGELAWVCPPTGGGPLRVAVSPEPGSLLEVVVQPLD